mgnify:CR=1 FL=1
MFDELVIGIGRNSKKKRYFELDDTIGKIQVVFKERPNIKVEPYSGLTVDFARKHQAKYMLRGLRNTTDFEYENSIAQANRQIFPDLETVLLITSPIYAHISSSIIREMHRFGQDLSGFMPYKP